MPFPLSSIDRSCVINETPWRRAPFVAPISAEGRDPHRNPAGNFRLGRGPRRGFRDKLLGNWNKSHVLDLDRRHSSSATGSGSTFTPNNR
jgi:hypothetical protein